MQSIIFLSQLDQKFYGIVHRLKVHHIVTICNQIHFFKVLFPITLQMVFKNNYH